MSTDLAPLINEATTLAITDTATMKSATELLSKVNKQLDAVKAEEEKVTKPLKAALKAEQDRWKGLKDSLTNAVTVIRNTMSDYMTAERKREAEAAAKLAARVEKGTMRLDTAAKKMTQIEVVDTKVATDDGMVSFRTSHVLVITDATAIPREYLVPDESAIKAALKAGKTVAGCVLEEKQVPVNYR